MTNSADNSGSDGDSIRVELAIDIDHPGAFGEIDKALEGKGIKLVERDAEAKTVQLELRSDSQLGDVQTLQDYLEKQTGFTTVVKGLGHRSSAVAELRPSIEAMRDDEMDRVMGVVRMSQLQGNKCFVDASVGGLYRRGQGVRNLYSLAMHEFGDLSSDNYDSIGRPVVEVCKRPVDEGGSKMSIRRIVPNCDVSSMIGKSVALSEFQDANDAIGRIISAGVIARASTVGANKKQICSCSGKTLWEERIDRRQADQKG